MSDSAREFEIPARLNLLLLAGASGASIALLFAASHAAGWPVKLAAAVVFSFTANTVFSLLHESVHGLLHPQARINRWGGRWAAAFFPTSLAIQRGFHLTHHRNNRSAIERFDYIEKGDIAWLKWLQWYAILTGIYWVVMQLGLLLYLIAPILLRVPVLRRAGSRAADQTSSRAYLAVFDDVDSRVVRTELMASLAFQASLFWTLDLNFIGWALCYGAFAINWSGLQYADHAFSPLNAHDGAWNLRANPVTRALFLNYHYHLAHHRYPQTPWLYLGRKLESGEPQPSFLATWLGMWRGPRRLA